MEELTEVITAAEFHPKDCNLLAYSSSKGIIRLCDMRVSALCDGNPIICESSSLSQFAMFSFQFSKRERMPITDRSFPRSFPPCPTSSSPTTDNLYLLEIIWQLMYGIFDKTLIRSRPIMFTSICAQSYVYFTRTIPFSTSSNAVGAATTSTVLVYECYLTRSFQAHCNRIVQ